MATGFKCDRCNTFFFPDDGASLQRVQAILDGKSLKNIKESREGVDVCDRCLRQYTDLIKRWWDALP